MRSDTKTFMCTSCSTPFTMDARHMNKPTQEFRSLLRAKHDSCTACRTPVIHFIERIWVGGKVVREQLSLPKFTF